MDLQLDGARSMVLASSSGIGFASARELVREGADVVISSRSESNLRAARDRIVDDTGVDGSSVVPVVCDLSEPAAVPEAIEEGVESLGGLDVLVTNSGGPAKMDFETSTRDDFERAYTTVLDGVIAAIDASLPALLDGDDGGAMTHLIAAAAQEPEANHVVGNTVRLGVYGLSKSLAREYAGEGLRSNCVCPRKVGPAPGGPETRHPHVEQYAAEHDLDYEAAADAYIEEIIPLGERGDLRSFGQLVAVLSSDVARFVTGQTLNVDGGWTRHVL